MPPDNPGTPDATLMGTGDPNPNQPASNPPWMAQLPDDLKKHEGLTKFATIGDLGKSYIDIAGKVEGTVRIPGENATDEEKSSFYSALGRPEAPDKYEFTRPTLPDGVQYDEKQEGAFRTMAHEIGLSQAQAEKLYGFYNNQIIESHSEYVRVVNEAKQEAEAALKKEWGEKYAGNLEIAKRAVREFGGEEITKFLETSRLGDNPLIVKLFNQIGQAMMEDQFKSGNLKDGKERETGIDGGPMLDFPSMDKQQ